MAATPSGKDKITRYLRLYVGGYDLSGDGLSFSGLENGFDDVEFTGWDEEVRNYLPGQRMVGINDLQVLMNDATGRSFDRLKDVTNTAEVAILFGGGGAPAVPDPAFHLPGLQLTDGVTIDSQRAVMSISWNYDAGSYAAQMENPLGVVLHGATSLSATTSADSHDNGGATSDGWSAALQVTASSGGTWAFTLEHSTDDAAWSTLGTFTANGSAVTSELLTGTGTVNQYVRFVATRTSGTVTPVVTFARN